MFRSEPLSIESLLQKQREEKEALSKVRSDLLLFRISHPSQPKFLSKEERAKIAIAKRTQEIREQKEKEETLRREREALEKDVNSLRAKPSNTSSSRTGAGRGTMNTLSHGDCLFNVF
jgi:ATP-dependent RNA helicase DDX23/PRP28